MRAAVLPFSTAEGVPDALGRQFATFFSDVLRSMGGEIYLLNLMSQLPDQPGRNAFVNLGETMMAKEQLVPIFDQVPVEKIVDGLVKKEGDGFHLTTRFTTKGDADNPKIEEQSFGKTELFTMLNTLVKNVGHELEIPLPPEAEAGTLQFGTANPEAFTSFLIGNDVLSYIRQANGMVISDFDPSFALDTLVQAVQMDPNFEGPYIVCLDLVRVCAQYRIGSFVKLEDTLKKLTELEPTDYRAWYVLAEIHAAVGEWAEATAYYEKAIEIEPNDPALYTKLGLAQMQQGMPANAERSFRMALDREGPDKPSLDFLCSVLAQSGRGHEIPTLWRERIDANPMEPAFHAKYAYALMQQGREEEGEKAFEHALATLEDPFIVKRYYAPLLAQKGEVDRAMDFYEDCLDVTPTDIPLMMEYAKTLEQAGRDFEIPQTLRNVLSANPDANTKAQANAWLIELEQPKRVEAVEEARKKVDDRDFEGAIRELKPLKTWMAEYWKFWAVLAHCYNQLGDFGEAEDAAGRLVNLMPGYEQGYSELMRALSGQEKFDQAYRAMKWARLNMPQSLPINLNYGLAAKQAGHVDEARALARQIREALGANPEFEPVLSEMEK